MKSVMKYTDGLLPNMLALLYILLTYCTGLLLITIDNLLLNFSGTLLLAHSMVIAAYMVHECAHNTIFINNKANATLGGVPSEASHAIEDSPQVQDEVPRQKLVVAHVTRYVIR